MQKKNWIKGAIKKPGSFKTMAHTAGMSTMDAANKWHSAPGIKGERARLASTLMGLSHKKK